VAGARRRAEPRARVTAMDPGVREIAIPPESRALSTLPRTDYVDAFVVETGDDRARSGEEWARALLEDAESGTRTALLAGWRGLGLRLGSTRSERFVLGWEIRRSTPGHALLAAASPVGLSAELLFEPLERGCLYATLVQQETAAARVIWAGMAPVHVRVVRSVLEQLWRRETVLTG
jgi:hypothetical protein